MRRTQQGVSIITAIFLLVVLSFLGVAMVSFSTAQHQGEAMDVMGSRAYQAARAGIEWAAYQVANSPASAVAAAPCATNFAAGSLGGNLSNFTVVVNCAPTSYLEGASTIWIYDVSAVAQAGGVAGDQNFVERVISVKLGR
jgi:MSHA biogenesis protein MshP